MRQAVSSTNVTSAPATIDVDGLIARYDGFLLDAYGVLDWEALDGSQIRRRLRRESAFMPMPTAFHHDPIIDRGP